MPVARSVFSGAKDYISVRLWSCRPRRLTLRNGSTRCDGDFRDASGEVVGDPRGGIRRDNPPRPFPKSNQPGKGSAGGYLGVALLGAMFIAAGCVGGGDESGSAVRSRDPTDGRFRVQSVTVRLGVLCLVGAVVVATGDQRWTSRVAVLGAASLLAGGVLLAIFVFSGDPYANGDGSRWSRRESHDLVYISWATTALGSGLLFVLSRLSTPRWQVATGLLIGTALIVLQAVAATSQNLN
jgi:hypothetical protein